MVLTSRSVAYYLLDRNLISLESLVDGDIKIVDESRRNLNFRVIRRRGRSYFVKQIQNWDPQTISALQREALCYWFAQNDPFFKPLASLLPTCHSYDQALNILVVELLQGENLSDHHRRLGTFPIDVAGALGNALGTYQQIGAQLEGSAQVSVFPKMVPWILSIHKYNPFPFHLLSGANAQLFGVLNQYPDFRHALDELSSDWQTICLIHGDMKWENCIVLGDAEAAGALCVKLIDWELADFGDPAWDAGAILQAYLSYWILSVPVAPGTSSAQLEEQAQHRLEEMQPAIRHFWNTYVATLTRKELRAKDLILRSLKYGAARMIQTVYEYMYRSSAISPNAIYLLQVSFNILQRPDEAISHLLGL